MHQVSLRAFDLSERAGQSQQRRVQGWREHLFMMVGAPALASRGGSARICSGNAPFFASVAAIIRLGPAWSTHLPRVLEVAAGSSSACSSAIRCGGRGDGARQIAVSRLHRDVHRHLGRREDLDRRSPASRPRPSSPSSPNLWRASAALACARLRHRTRSRPPSRPPLRCKSRASCRAGPFASPPRRCSPRRCRRCDRGIYM